MRFFQSTHLLFLLVDLHVHHKDWQTLLVDLIDMVNSYNFKWSQMTLILLSQMALLRWLTQWDSWLWLSQSSLLDLFFLVTQVFVIQWLSLHWEILIMWLYQFPSIWLSVPLKNGSLVSLCSFFLTFIVLIGMVFVIIWEMFYERISLNLGLLVFLRIAVGEFKLELMYIFLSVNIRSPSFICMFFSCFFCSHSSWKSSESKVKFRQAINICKRVLEAVELAYANKTKASIFSQKLDSLKFSNY